LISPAAHKKPRDADPEVGSRVDIDATDAVRIVGTEENEAVRTGGDTGGESDVISGRGGVV
jgi:hypothetical protein